MEPLAITLVIPTSLADLERQPQNNRGVYARATNPVTVRMNQLELEEIDTAAERLGVSRSTFLRYVAYKMAEGYNDGVRNSVGLVGEATKGYSPRGVKDKALRST